MGRMSDRDRKDREAIRWLKAYVACHPRKPGLRRAVYLCYEAMRLRKAHADCGEALTATWNMAFENGFDAGRKWPRRSAKRRGKDGGR